MQSSRLTNSYHAASPNERFLEVAYTRTGTAFNPNDSKWKWTEDVFTVCLDFAGLRVQSGLIYPLKRTLLVFARGSSASHLQNLFNAFQHFLENRRGADPLATITIKDVANYAASLKQAGRWRLGTLNVLLQKWAALGLFGLEEGCAAYLEERRKPGNVKGEAVRTRNPITGPFSEAEYTALYKAVDAAYGQRRLPRWAAVLTRLLFACGGRISQYASLKVIDFRADHGSFVLLLPQVKRGDECSRSSFKDFSLSPQTGRFVQEYLEELKLEGFETAGSMFPARLVMPLSPHVEPRSDASAFVGHCTRDELSRGLSRHLESVAPPTQRLDYSTLPVRPKRFRYTFGTRLVEEGASQAVVADQLGHADLQNVGCYFEASPKIVESIDRAMGVALAPLAAAFKGRLIEGEEQSTHKGALGSRIIDFRVATQPLASCAGQGAGCSFNKPVACYTCFKFEPWLDAPHEKVLERLERERERYSGDERMAAVNDDAILAIRQVIAQCEHALKHRREKGPP